MIKIYTNILLLNVAGSLVILLLCKTLGITLDTFLSVIFGLINGMFISVGYGMPAMKKYKEENVNES